MWRLARCAVVASRYREGRRLGRWRATDTDIAPGSARRPRPAASGRPRSPPVAGVVRPESATLPSNRFGAHSDPTLRTSVLDVSQTEGKSVIEENSVGDDLWEKTESAGDGSSCFHDGLSARVARCDRADTGAVLDGTAGGGGLKLEVQHAGNRVRAVLRSRTIPQHFDLPQRDGEDRDADKRPDPPSLLLTRASYAGDTPWRRNRCRAARPRAARLIAVSWCSGRLAGISCSSSRPSISVRPLSRASVVPRPRFRCALEPPCLPRHRFGSLHVPSERRLPTDSAQTARARRDTSRSRRFGPCE